MRAILDGVVEVDNDLVVNSEKRPDETRTASAENDSDDGDRSFGAWIDDATTTASVKTKLVANSNTSGLQIDVDTRGDAVTLASAGIVLATGALLSSLLRR